jgi:hypothetical protein
MGIPNAFRFLEANQDLVFNDLSLEHGGFFPRHNSHQKGTSIDVRYFGPGGDSNPLNGAAQEPLATHRRDRLVEAQNAADPVVRMNALREMIEWIRLNRARMDQILSDSRVRLIYIGDATWNVNSLRLGRFADGTPILDPDQGNAPIGAWTPSGTVTNWPGHLDHAHIELKRTP